MNLRQLWSPKTAQIVPILIGKINCNHFRGKLHTGCPCQRSDSHWERKLVTEDGQGGGRITVSKVAWFLSQVRVDVFTEQAAEASASVNLEGLINDSYIVCQVHISCNETDCKHRGKSSAQYSPCPETPGTILWVSPQF